MKCCNWQPVASCAAAVFCWSGKCVAATGDAVCYIDTCERWFFAVVSLLLLVLTVLLLRSRRQQQQAMERLSEQEERLRLVLEGTRDGFWDWDATTGVGKVGERWCLMLGYSPDELEPTFSQWQSLIHPDDLAATMDRCQQCIAGGDDYFVSEFRLRTKDGGWKWILSRGMVVERNHDGTPRRVVGAHSDISAHKKVELELKKALVAAEEGRNKIDAILSSMADGLLVFDNDCAVTAINASALHILGKSADDVIGMDAAQLFPEGEFNLWLRQVQAGTNNRNAIDVDMFDRQHEKPRTFQARFSRIVAAHGSCDGVVVTLQDVTVLRKMSRRKSEFISGVAHELRTPLTAVMGFAELLLGDESLPPQQRREYLQIIVDKSEQLSSIVDDLLDFTRLEMGRREPCSVKSGAGDGNKGRNLPV